jgi:hypothetical protein
MEITLESVVDPKKLIQDVSTYRDGLEAISSQRGLQLRLGSNLDPRLSWAITRTYVDREPTPAEVLELGRLAEGTHTKPSSPKVITTANQSPRHSDFVQVISESTGEVQFMVAEPRSGASNMQRALDILPMASAAAGVETTVLIREVVMLAETDLTASHDQLFGVVIAGELFCLTVPGSVEALLHETGHHRMFLLEIQRDFVTNPDLMVRHPLRPDPRPIKGTLHAAYVLARMSLGMTALQTWALEHEPSMVGEAKERAQLNRDRLVATCRTLSDNAEWTEAGRQLFSKLDRVAEQRLGSE